MGIYSTLDITREDAIYLIRKGVEKASDEIALYREKVSSQLFYCNFI